MWINFQAYTMGAKDYLLIYSKSVSEKDFQLLYHEAFNSIFYFLITDIDKNNQNEIFISGNSNSNTGGSQSRLLKYQDNSFINLIPDNTTGSISFIKDINNDKCDEIISIEPDKYDYRLYMMKIKNITVLYRDANGYFTPRIVPDAIGQILYEILIPKLFEQKIEKRDYQSYYGTIFLIEAVKK